MATTYSTNLKLGKPAVADRNWNVALNANADQLDALAPLGGLCVSTLEVPSASLNVQVAPGCFQKSDGTMGSFAGSASFALAASQTSVLFLNDDGTLSVSTTGYPSTGCIPLATVVTGPTSVTSVTDNRVVCSVVGTDALPYLPLAGGTLADGAQVALGTSTGTRIGTSTTQKLAFWNATPVPQPSPYIQVYNTSIKTLAAYTPIVESTAYSGLASGQAGTPYAQVADLNTLRTAYENLRQFAENLAQVLNALVDDLQSTGLVG
ncbi:MAG: hypothetical protein ACP5XB_02455 [Isosphaeraceae bacterium]